MYFKVIGQYFQSHSYKASPPSAGKHIAKYKKVQTLQDNTKKTTQTIHCCRRHKYTVHSSPILSESFLSLYFNAVAIRLNIQRFEADL